MAPFTQFGVGPSPDDLVDALVVKPDRHSAGGKEDSHAIAHDERSRVIDLEPATAVQLHWILVGFRARLGDEPLQLVYFQART
jgi:hypothetical protein